MRPFDDVRFLRSPDDDGPGGGDGDGPTEGGSGGAGGGSGGDAAPAWAKDMVTGIGQLNEGFRALTDMARAAQGRQTPAAPPADPDDEPEDEPSGTDLETMSRREYADYLLRQMIKATNKQIAEPLSAQIRELSASATRQQATMGVREAAAAHKDFWDWQGEMVELVNQPQYKSLIPVDLYALARSRNPSKAAELDKKHNPQKPSDSRPIKLPAFGGLTPGQSGTGNRGRKMNGHEAADAAWAETVKALGGEPLFEE